MKNNTTLRIPCKPWLGFLDDYFWTGKLHQAKRASTFGGNRGMVKAIAIIPQTQEWFWRGLTSPITQVAGYIQRIVHRSLAEGKLRRPQHSVGFFTIVAEGHQGSSRGPQMESNVLAPSTVGAAHSVLSFFGTARSNCALLTKKKNVPRW